MSYILIVDGSKADREFIRGAIAATGSEIEVRCVDDAFLAREMIAQEDPHLIVLDVDLPRMSGGEFLGHLMRHHPLPVIVATRASNADSNRVEKLQLLGAVQTLYKPSSVTDETRFMEQFHSIVETVMAIQDKAIQNRAIVCNESMQNYDNDDTRPASETRSAGSIAIAIGASTGGPMAISQIVRHFSANSPPILIAQHISNRFLKAMVKGWQRLTDMQVTIAEHGTQVTRGGIYVAPPERHMEIDLDGRIKLLSMVATDRYAPSINILFNSLARRRHTTVIAALLTGMGDDGADGLLRLRTAGANTISEHQSTCVVYGMPARAEEIGAASEVLRLPEIGPRIAELVAQAIESRQRRKMREPCDSLK
ncbi:MAG: chemotaxis protein CheB [Pirellulaceae bacterium]|nr:chemotaxis protein CheB [Pirellulaceae bacterium]